MEELKAPTRVASSELVRLAIRQAANEEHRRRVGYDASEAWLNNSVKWTCNQQSRLLHRALQILDEQESNDQAQRSGWSKT